MSEARWTDATGKKHRYGTYFDGIHVDDLSKDDLIEMLAKTRTELDALKEALRTIKNLTK